MHDTGRQQTSCGGCDSYNWAGGNFCVAASPVHRKALCLSRMRATYHSCLLHCQHTLKPSGLMKTDTVSILCTLQVSTSSSPELDCCTLEGGVQEVARVAAGGVDIPPQGGVRISVWRCAASLVAWVPNLNPAARVCTNISDKGALCSGDLACAHVVKGQVTCKQRMFWDAIGSRCLEQAHRELRASNQQYNSSCSC